LTAGGDFAYSPVHRARKEVAHRNSGFAGCVNKRNNSKEGFAMKTGEQELLIERMSVGNINVWIKGKSPLIMHCMPEKSRHELLMPKGKKTAADKAQNMKHDPLQEYRASVYRKIGTGNTRLAFPAAAIKSALCNAALETPGTKKTQIGRLVWVNGDMLEVYGKPKMLMSVVRSADMNHTPDIRTRAILPEWCCLASITFATPTLSATSLGNLLTTAGMIIGLGDFRQAKGKGNYGQFEPSTEEDCKQIVENGGMKIQDDALETPEFYDADTETLFTWFCDERTRRGK
jgi:hypothetical protein